MLNLKKLNKVVHKIGKIEAQCPACAAAGADSKGNHLVVYPDGRYGCVANPGDSEHNKAIFKLAGQDGGETCPQLQIRTLEVAESTVLMKLGRLGQKKPAPAGKCAEPETTQTSTGVSKTGPNCPGRTQAPVEEGEITTDMAREFLKEP